MLRNQGKKRKRRSSESSNDNEMILPENALETERNVHASAVKNNLDETSVRKIIKKVVTNDHVLALVKLREEEENSSLDDKKLQPKLTRAKVKELKKVSTCKSAAWDLENLELTPIKHIPVKTRPEVKALIAQELPDDEDDDEYEPTHDDVPSDDDHMESSSDLDSQPRTPATPATPASSPCVVKDGPFKVPQDISKARRKLEIDEEEATIALRTRSKLSLSSTSIEHIESTFVPPDDIPIQDVDDLWNEFLNECLNPASAARNDDDDETLDETDPEYNVAADVDAHDEDEESLSNSIIKISKKELNDLVTELFSILPEAAEEELAGDLANSVLTDNTQIDDSSTNNSRCQTKQEPLSDDENGKTPSQKLEFEDQHSPKVTDKNKNVNVNDGARGGTEKESTQSDKGEVQKEKIAVPFKKRAQKLTDPRFAINTRNKTIEISIEEALDTAQANDGEVAPPSLRQKIKPVSQTVRIQVDSDVTMSHEQIQIFQQQLRQHVQLAASNFMQTVVHPVHWKLAPQCKEYLVSLHELVDKKENSLVNVCNLKPAYELIITWEKSVTEDTEYNRKMIEFTSGEVDKCRRRISHNSLYSGDFHETFKKVVANSPVFLYPYLLPCMPYRPDAPRKFCYLHSEDTLIVLGLDQFWQYVESNPEIFKLYRNPVPRARRGFMATVDLVTKHMLPWMPANRLAGHINTVRAGTDEHNPIYRYFKYNEMPEIKHRILPFNPSLTLYEQPEFEMPRIWVRYLAKTSQRFRKFYHKRSTSTVGRQPLGVEINPNIGPQTVKKALPIDFTKQIISHRATLHEITPKEPSTNRLDVDIQKSVQNTQNQVIVASNFYRLVETSTGAYLLPLQVATNTVDSSQGPITTPFEVSSVIANNLPETRVEEFASSTEHCTCCTLLRKICKHRQPLITEYFKAKKRDKKCYCNDINYPKMSNRLRFLVRHCKKRSEVVFRELERRLKGGDIFDSEIDLNSKDMAHVLAYHLKVFTKASMSKRIYVKKRVSNLLSHFDVTSGNPIKLANDLFKAFDVELVDLYLDFLIFLTPQQAETLGAFKDYFTRNCAEDLIKMVEDHVPDKPSRNTIYTQLKKILSGNLSPCEMCTYLLKTMEGRETLARYTFNLFPHTKENRPSIPVKTASISNKEKNEKMTVPVYNEQRIEGNSTVCSQQERDHKVYVNNTLCQEEQRNETAMECNIKVQVNETDALSDGEQTEVIDTVGDEQKMVVDYEADHSSSGEENDSMSIDPESPSALPQASDEIQINIKQEPNIEETDPLSQEIVSLQTVNESDSDLTTSAIIDDDMKHEQTTDWIKEEDRIILQVLQEHLTKEERKDKSIRELLEEKNVYIMLFDALDRTLCEIKERVLYLLTMLIVSESDTLSMVM